MRPIRDRLLEKVAIGKPDWCWPWLGSKRRGYGLIKFNGKVVSAHRIAYELSYGAIPDGMTIDHLCRNPSCCNAYHMEVVSGAENTKRRNKAITHCPKGHQYSPENTYVYKKRRHCRACHRRYSHA